MKRSSFKIRTSFYKLFRLLYLIINIYSILFFFKKIVHYVDFAILFIFNSFVLFYTLLRKLLFFIFFKPISFFFRFYGIVLLYLIHDVQFLGGHIYYLLVKSDVFDVQLKWRRFASTMMVLYFVLIFRLYLSMYIFIKKLSSFFIPYYFSFFCIELTLDLYTVLYNFSLFCYLICHNCLILINHLIGGFLLYPLYFLLQFYFFFKKNKSSRNFLKFMKFSKFLKKYSQVVSFNTASLVYVYQPYFIPGRFNILEINQRFFASFGSLRSFSRIQRIYFVFVTFFIYPILYVSRLLSFILVSLMASLFEFFNNSIYQFFRFVSYCLFTFILICVYIIWYVVRFLILAYQTMISQQHKSSNLQIRDKASLFTFNKYKKKICIRLFIALLINRALSQDTSTRNSNVNLALFQFLMQDLPFYKYKKKKEVNKFIQKQLLIHQILIHTKITKLPLSDLILNVNQFKNSNIFFVDSRIKKFRLQVLQLYLNSILLSKVNTLNKLYFVSSLCFILFVPSLKFIRSFQFPQLNLFKDLYNQFYLYKSVYPIRRGKQKSVWIVRIYSFIKFYFLYCIMFFFYSLGFIFFFSNFNDIPFNFIRLHLLFSFCCSFFS